MGVRRPTIVMALIFPLFSFQKWPSKTMTWTRLKFYWSSEPCRLRGWGRSTVLSRSVHPEDPRHCFSGWTWAVCWRPDTVSLLELHVSAFYQGSYKLWSCLWIWESIGLSGFILHDSPVLLPINLTYHKYRTHDLTVSIPSIQPLWKLSSWNLSQSWFFMAAKERNE